MIARKTFREMRWMALTYMAVLEAMLVPAILLWPNLRPDIAAVGRMLPFDAFKRMFEAIGSSDSAAAFSSYFAVQIFFKGVNIIGLSGAVLFGTSLIARERETHTLEFLLARPVSRSRVLAAKYLVAAALITVPIFLTSWSAIFWAAEIDESISFAYTTMACVHASAFVLSILSLTTICSVVARTQMHAAFAIGVFIVVQATIYFIQEVRVASVFRLSDFDVYGPILAGNRSLESMLWGGSTMWLLVAAGGGYWIADFILRRTDP